MYDSMIGIKFYLGKTEYVVDSVEPIAPEMIFIIASMGKSGKYPAQFFASKVLASGKKSVQGGMFYRFIKSGNFLKVL